LDEQEDSAEPGPWRKWLCWSLAGAVLLWAIARTFGLESGYPFVQLMVYTPYILLLSMLACLAIVLLRQWLPFIFGVIGVVALAIAVVPRELGGPEEAPPGEAIRLLSLNTWRGNADVTQLLEIIEARDVNVLSLQELPINGVKRLKRRGLEKILPYRVLGIEERGGGGVYSRFPAHGMAPTRTRLRQPRAMIKPPGSVPFEVMSVHPRAPQGPGSTRQWAREMSRLPEADEPGPPRVLAGDLNSTLDHKELRDLIDTGYRDAADTIGSGLVTTWPSKLKWPLPVTIDHVLVEEPIKITGYDVEANDNSDHRAVYAELVIPHTQEGK
jgi:endonuclease/exonuclease/phosphatase (EEP) superfamily protein YafD